MSEQASIFNPTDDSLAERVRAYRSAHKAWLNVEPSLKHLDDPEWSNTLGEVQEVEDAHRDIIHSLNQAAISLSSDDIDQALNQGLVDEDEASQIMNQKNNLSREQILEQDQSFELDM